MRGIRLIQLFDRITRGLLGGGEPLVRTTFTVRFSLCFLFLVESKALPLWVQLLLVQPVLAPPRWAQPDLAPVREQEGEFRPRMEWGFVWTSLASSPSGPR